MQLAEVVGTVVASRKEEVLDGLRFLVLKPLDANLNATGGVVVAADAVGAGVGEVVLFASGSSARQTQLTNNRPVDAVVMAIVDLVELSGDIRYRKD
ncbi:MAG: EutN/CcmL family microcompartment protein [bacterium]